MKFTNVVGTGRNLLPMLNSNLPRLLYLGDLPIEQTLGGPALLYQLLQDYPAELLMVLQYESWQMALDQRLPGVCYKTYRLPVERLASARLGLAKLVGTYRYLTARRRAPALASQTVSFGAQAVVTIAHGYTWITAAAFALQNGLPLYLIVHDHVPDMLARACIPWIVLKRLDLMVDYRRWMWNSFRSVYRQAARRWCISPQMAEAYGRLGAPAQVMYPLRARDVVAFDSPPARALRRQPPLALGYVGSLGPGGYASLLSTLAQVIEPDGGKLVLYTQPNPPEWVIARPNVEFRGFLPSEQLIPALREDVDVLVAPMSFDPRDRRTMELGFPSKLSNYTAACLPILIWGPSYSSAVLWGKSNPGVAEIVEEDNSDAIAAAVKRLSSDVDRCAALACTAAAAGSRDFGWHAIRDQFFAGICQDLNTPCQYLPKSHAGNAGRV